MLYRITSGRWDTPTRVYKEFEADEADNDAAAKKTFREISERKENSWETMFLYRVDQVEKTTMIGTARVQEREGWANDL